MKYLTWKDFECCYAGKIEISKYKTGIEEIDKTYTDIEW